MGGISFGGGAAGPSLGGPNTYTGAQTVAPVIAAVGANYTPDAKLSNTFRLTLGANLTLGAPTDPADGQVLNLELIQDGTGNRVITWPAAFTWSGAAPVLSTAAGAVDLCGLIYNAAAGKWRANLVKGFA